jgi:hypothetical protein
MKRETDKLPVTSADIDQAPAEAEQRIMKIPRLEKISSGGLTGSGLRLSQ